MKIIINENQFIKLNKQFNKSYQKHSISVSKLKKMISEDAVKDIPSKADFVKDNLTDFYKTLEDAVKKGGLSQQSRGGMTYQKEVESLQIGLLLLGYDLSKHGVDGLFGPETAAAVKKFTEDNVKETPKDNRSFIKRLLNINEVNVSIGPFKGDLENGPSNHGKRAFGNWQSDNAWDLFAPIGTTVNSYTKGIVSKVRESGGRNPKVYGTQVTVKGEDGYPDIFYTHIENVKLNKGDSVNVGDFIGTVKEWPGHTATHVHVGLQRGYHLRDLLNNSNTIFNGSGNSTAPIAQSGGSSSDIKGIVATPEMITKLIEMLKSLNIKSSDVKKFTDTYLGNDGPIATGDVLLKGNFDGVQRKNISLLIDEMKKIGINNPYTQIGILSVISKESNFRPKGEVSYATTSNSRIRTVFGSRVAGYSDSELNDLKKDPKQFFNVVYAKTVGNQGGDDGWTYRGRGFNQLTGIKNYEKYGRMIGMGDDLVKNPDLVNDPKIATKIALAFFTKGKPGSSFPNFNNKEEAAGYFADINAGGHTSSHRKNALIASTKFDVKDNLA